MLTLYYVFRIDYNLLYVLYNCTFTYFLLISNTIYIINELYNYILKYMNTQILNFFLLALIEPLLFTLYNVRENHTINLDVSIFLLISLSEIPF